MKSHILQIAAPFVLVTLFVNATETIAPGSPDLSSMRQGNGAVVLTPKPGAIPRLNGPTIYGARPGTRSSI